MGTETKTEPGSVEELLTRDPSELTKPIKAVQDKWNLVPAFLKVFPVFPTTKVGRRDPS